MSRQNFGYFMLMIAVSLMLILLAGAGFCDADEGDELGNVGAQDNNYFINNSDSNIDDNNNTMGQNENSTVFNDIVFNDTGLDDTVFNDTLFNDTVFNDTGLDDTGLDDTGLDDTGLDDQWIDGVIILGDDLTEPTDVFQNFAYLGAYDRRAVENYGNKNLSLGTLMNNTLEFDSDGTIKKTQFRALYSNGSELLNIDDISAFSGYDQLGNKYSSRKQTSVGLTNFSFPFVLLSNEVITLDGNDLDWKGTSIENYLLIPELSEDERNEISDLLGNVGGTKILNISANNVTDALKSTQSIWGQFVGEEQMGGFFTMLKNEEMWDTIESMAQQYQDEQERKKNAMRDIATDFSSSSGGITCIWGYRE